MGAARALWRATGLYRIYEGRLERQIRGGVMPGHLAVILDGNRRWAKRHLEAASGGHDRGADAVENLLDWCEDLGIRIVTLYALSAENMGRDEKEVAELYDVIRARLEKLHDDPRIHRSRMRVKGIGRTELLPGPVQRALERLDAATRGYDTRFLNIALAYGGQHELVDAVRRICEKVVAGEMPASGIDRKAIESHLYTSHLPQPSPDMILRTSGEKRLSGFLLWQSAYSELVFMDVFWPEFRKIDLMRAIRTYQERKRRLGR